MIETRLGRFCDRLIEAGWLLAVVLVPTFFNVHTSRTFEPDKGTFLCSLALVMTAAWLVKAVERAIYWLCGRLRWIEWSRADQPRRPWPFYALIVLSVLLAIVYLGSTLISVHPRTSLIGFYVRGQDTLFTLCLIVISLLVATHLRTRSQVGRLLAAVALGSLPVTLYAVIQRLGADPLPWSASEPVVVSTLGNPAFLAAYLVMAIPLTFAGLLALVPAAWHALRRTGETTSIGLSILQTLGYGFLLLCGLPILGLQAYALVLTHARIAPLALLVAAVPFVLLLIAIPIRRTWRRWIPLGLASILILGILLALTVVSFAHVSLAESPIAQVMETDPSLAQTARQLIWEGSRELFYTRPAAGGQPDRWQRLRPLLGYGPETMFLTYNQVYQPELGHYEPRASLPDRAHNQLLDVGVNLGWVGVVVFLLLLVAFFVAAIATVSTARGVMEAIFASGVLAAGLAHFVEAQFNIAVISTRLLFWVGLGVLAALVSRREAKPSASLPGQFLASGVALLLLPMIALTAVAVAGFLRIIPEIVAPGIVMLIGIILAAIAAVLNVTVGWRKPEEAKEYWKWLYPAATGLLAVMTFFLSACTGLLVSALASGLSKPLPGPPDIDAILQQARVFPILAWSCAGLGLLGIALSLPRHRAPLVMWNWRNLVAFVTASPVYVLIAAGAAALILITSVRPVQADAVFKQAQAFDRVSHWERASDFYEQVIELAPHRDFYYIYLGRAWLEQARQEENSTHRETLLTQALEVLERAQALSPLDPDHTANLARFHGILAGLETDSATREIHARAADSHYADATVLAPYNVILWNQWAMLQRDSLHDKAEACRLLEHSLELDAEFEWTLSLYAETCAP